MSEYNARTQSLIHDLGAAGTFDLEQESAVFEHLLMGLISNLTDQQVSDLNQEIINELQVVDSDLSRVVTQDYDSFIQSFHNLINSQ